MSGLLRKATSRRKSVNTPNELGRGSVLVMIAVMLVVGSLMGGVSLLLLYDTSFKQMELRLIEIAKSRARIIDSIAAFDARESIDFPGGAEGATLFQIRDAHTKFPGFGETGEFTLAKREDGNIVFLLRRRHDATSIPEPVPMWSKLAEPMRRALNGASGVVVGPDYRGVTVLAAFEPLRELDFGVVAKINLAEIRDPFIKVALIIGMLGVLASTIGSIVIFRTANPIFHALSVNYNRFRNLFQSVEISIWNEDFSKVHQHLELLRAEGVEDLRSHLIEHEEVLLELVNEVQVIEVNDATLVMFRAGSKREFVDNLQNSFADDTMETFREAILAVWRGERYFRSETNFRAFDGREFEAIISYRIPRTVEGFESMAVSIVDISQQKETEKNLRRVNAALRTLSKINEALVQSPSRTNLLDSAVRILVEDGNYRMAWIGIALEDETKTVEPIARYGAHTDYLDEMEISWADDKKGTGPTGRAIRSGKTVVFQDLVKNSNYYMFRKAAIARGYRSSAAIPFMISAGDRGAINIYAAESDAFQEEEINLLETLAEDVQFGLSKIERDAQLYQAGKLATLGEMSTSIAHELNQPLNIISMAAQSAEEDLEDGHIDIEFLLSKLKRIRKQIQRAVGITDHMRVFGRRAPEENELYDPCDVIESALDLTGKQLDVHGIDVEKHFPDNRDVQVDGSPQLLEQVLINLINNARDAIDQRIDVADKHGRLRFDVDSDIAGGIDIAVSDSGGGIPEDLLEKIFDPFFTTKEVGEGTGLGLSISYGIIKDMKGTINARNVGAGAKFTIHLPSAGASRDHSHAFAVTG